MTGHQAEHILAGVGAVALVAYAAAAVWALVSLRQLRSAERRAA